MRQFGGLWTKATEEIELDNKQIVAEVYVEGFSKGRMEVLDRYIRSNYVNHQLPSGALPGVAGLKSTITALRRRFPDLRYIIEDLLAEDDRVAVRATMAGTDRGGAGDVAPTGMSFEVPSLAMIRLERGMVVERWGLHDVELMAAQLST